jgi:hypothetical protein
MTDMLFLHVGGAKTMWVCICCVCVRGRGGGGEECLDLVFIDAGSRTTSSNDTSIASR